MGTTAFDLLGGQLHDFLVQQFAPPPGASTALGFLGTGIAVDAPSFQSDGVFNPARVNTWLEIVVDPLGAVEASGDQADFVPWTATQLLGAIYTQAMSVAPAGSDQQEGFNKAKSTAMEGLGGATVVSTAPLDWYDPAQIPQWPSCTLNASTSSGVGSPTPPPAPSPGRPIYWGWRNIAAINAVAEPPARLTPPPGNPSVIDHRRMVFATHATATVAAPAVQARMMMAAMPMARMNLAVSETAQATAVTQMRVDRVPIAMMASRTIDSNLVLARSQQTATAASQATSSSFASNSMSLSLKYRVVSLSRAPWWNEFFLTLNNWFVPGCKRGSLIDAGGDSKKIPGVPIAMILTTDVSVRAAWSAADRTALAANTHLGPWSVDGAQFSSVAVAGDAVMTIPGVTAIACIYRQLPVLPPQPDPSLTA